jgi:glyoxylase-like metal-dependent hydrolase (beta-lactamase superfamily II)
MLSATHWDSSLPAQKVTGTIWTSPSVTDSHLVTTPDGDVVINTGFHFHGPRHRERFEQALARPLDVRKIVFTQGYFEQIGGWPSFSGPNVETIAQHDYPNTLYDQMGFGAFFRPRNFHVLHAIMPKEQMESSHAAFVPPEVDTLFHDSHRIEVGGRSFDLYSVPGGEATDCLAVWLPDERVVFTGNLIGALYGAFPNLYTIRGARLRSARRFLQSCQRVLDLEPEIHITGHDDPIFGAERIRTDLRKVMDAVAFIHDRTVDGMNAGKDLWTLMNEITLPESLEPAPGRGPVPWYVRTVWEEYSGWARFESTTELYGTPPSSVWADLVELAGGVDAIAARAGDQLANARPLEAIHLTDMALSIAPDHRTSLKVAASSHEMLLERAGDNFDELGYLESSLNKLQARLGGPS